MTLVWLGPNPKPFIVMMIFTRTSPLCQQYSELTVTELSVQLCHTSRPRTAMACHAVAVHETDRTTASSPPSFLTLFYTQWSIYWSSVHHIITTYRKIPFLVWWKNHSVILIWCFSWLLPSKLRFVVYIPMLLNQLYKQCQEISN